MKIPKKIWSGLAAFSLVLLVVFNLSGKVLAAAGQDDITDPSNGYTFIDGANIQADIGGAGTVTFTDVNVFDHGDRDRNFVPNDSAGFCEPNENIGYNPDKISKSIRYGIDIDKDVDLTRTDIHGTYQIPAQMKLGYMQGNNCVGVLLNIKVQSNERSAATIFQWNGNDIVNLNGNDEMKFSAVNGSDKDNVYLSTTDDDCGVNSAIKMTGENKGIYFKLSKANSRDPSKRANPDYAPTVSKYLTDGGKNCHYDGSINPAYIGGSKGTAAVGYVSLSSDGSDDDSSDCLASSHSGLEWLFCPLTTSLSKAAIGLENIINDQLHFDINRNLNNSGGVHQAWAIIRTVASTLVIILLLVMVFSQAIGGAFLDAYTVKKMLPRLVVAVIAMQISWDLCRYLISLANDLGEGLKQLMVAPFAGNGGGMDLNSILHKLNPAWAGLSNLGLFLAAGIGIVVAFFALPGTFVMIFSLFVGIFAAFMVLLFRNVLIVALTIFAPVAFLAWTISNSQGGMQSLWKMWKDNFTKLLMLFPLLIGIIYTGRIFAWIIASTNQGKPGPIDVLTIFVAYFAPYFIVFRAYKWGGSLLSAAGSGVASARKGITNANSGWLKTMGERFQGNAADRWSVQEKRARELQNRINALKESGRDKTPAEKARLERAQKELDRLKTPLRRGTKKVGGVPLPYAYLSRPSKDWMKNAAYRIGAGTPIPSERMAVETLAKAGAYKKDLVDKKHALMHTDFVEELNRTGDVGASKAYIERKYGIENYEQNADGSRSTKAKDKYTERAFFNWTVDSASWMELGDEDWRMGARKGKIKAAEFMAGGRFAKRNKAVGTHLEAREAEKLSKQEWVLGYASDPTLSTEDIILNGAKPKFDIAKTPGFVGMMNADAQRYRAVAEKLPLLQPFHQALGGGPKPTDFIPEIRNGGTVIQAGGNRADPKLAVDVNDYMAGGKYDDLGLNPHNDPVRAEQLARQKADRLAMVASEDARYMRWLRNLEHPTDLGQVRAEHYNLMNNMVQALKEAGVQSQSAGALQSMLDELAQANSVEGRSIMQRLMGGEKSARAAIDDMFGYGYLEDKLNVRVRIPTSVELEESPILSPEVKQRYAREILKVTGIDKDTKRPILSPDAVDLVKSVAADYDTRVLLNKTTNENQQWQLISELRESASGSRDLSNVFNAIIDQMTASIQSRVEGVVRQAAAEGKTGDDLARVRDIAVRLANAQIARYQSIKITPIIYDPPVPNGTLVVEHEYEPTPPVPPGVLPPPPPQPSTWSNPGGPLPPAK